MMKVIDISAWQENIDWKAVKDIGIGGVIIKIGEKTHLDDMFITHVNNAVTYNLPYGIYYYAHASTIDEAIAEANWVDKQIKTYLNGQNPPLGIWYDAEDKDMLDGYLNVVYPIANFISTLLDKGYNYVGLYSSYNWLTNIIDLKALPDYVPIWSAQYYHQNSFAMENPHRICRMWQYTDCERIGDMRLDCNVYYE
ncbi:GH25 family lysozyme [Megamonas funiformis]|jgi:GH25 family lysozyme M1 (1,4-beta-N-acetylmuramidase)|uniref:GH25 family lysozyme n=1 Tax=Megamonas funiformis TaxID=437897 RepID=UPI00241D9ECE|nr:GH25 family lysozyme [Megamonas funiformis]